MHNKNKTYLFHNLLRGLGIAFIFKGVGEKIYESKKANNQKIKYSS